MILTEAQQAAFFEAVMVESEDDDDLIHLYCATELVNGREVAYCGTDVTDAVELFEFGGARDCSMCVHEMNANGGLCPTCGLDCG